MKDTKYACKGIIPCSQKPTLGYEVVLDDKENTSPHYFNPVTKLRL
jgi:MFS family permease